MATSNLAAVPSGELFYRAGCAEKSLAEGTSEEFREFLASDSNGEVQAERFAYQLGSLKKIKGLATANFEHAASLEKELCTKGLESIINSHISVMKCKHARITAALDRLQTSHDASMMTLTLQYFDILKKELEENRKALYSAAREAELLKRQAKVLHDINLFALYLHYETKRKISLQSLESESSQFRRCKKAINDSVGPNLSKMGYRDTKVLAVLKLEHALISNQLQKSAGSIDQGKVKGLFCVIPKGGLYAFLSFGLHAQNSLRGSRGSALENVREGLPNLFQVSWIWAECEDSEATEGDLTGGRGAHFAENLARESMNVIHSYVSPRSEGETRNSHQDYDKTRDCSFLKFSRCSTPTGIEMLPKDHMEEGCFIALCRVLISKSRSIAGPITDRDAREAIDMGYDCVYSKATEEYILLKPRYVLPEFVMHVQMVPFSEKQDSSKAMGLEHGIKARKDAMGINKSTLNLEKEEETWLPDCLTYSEDISHPNSSGGPELGSSLRRKAQNSMIQNDLSTSINCQNVGEILASNDMMRKMHRSAPQDEDPALLGDDMDEGEENMLDDESISALKNSSSRENSMRKQAIENAIKSSTHDFNEKVRELYRKEFYVDDEEEGGAWKQRDEE